MPAHPFDHRTLHWNAPPKFGGGGMFRPHGKLTSYGSKINPTTWSSKRTLSGRIIVGFSVGQVPTYTMADLIAIVERVRLAQVGDPSSTFVAQHGIYQHADPKDGVVHEDGAQVFIINITNVSDMEFERQIVELAEIIARELQQESVIAEIQLNGISQQTMGIEP